MTTQALERAAFRWLPVAVLLVAFGGICVMTGTIWPWNRVVHEDGVRTLLGTIFFVEHATRELLPDLVLALGVAGAVRTFYPIGTARGADARRLGRRYGGLSALVIGGILIATFVLGGAHLIGDNLSQSHTRAGAPLVWGAHWRYHLIERLAQMLLAFAAIGALWMLDGRPMRGRGRPRARVFYLALVVFGVLTLVFRPTLEPFRDPAFLGHQLRELVTHALVTLPLALGVCLTLARTSSGSERRLRSTASVAPIVVAGLASVACGVFLLAAAVAADAQSHGQTTGLAALLWPHFAEHCLGYVVVPVVAGFLYLWPASVLDDVAFE